MGGLIGGPRQPMPEAGAPGMPNAAPPANPGALYGLPATPGPAGNNLARQNAAAWNNGGYQKFTAAHPDPTPMDFRGRMPGKKLPNLKEIKPYGQ